MPRGSPRDELAPRNSRSGETGPPTDPQGGNLYQEISGMYL